VSYFGMQQNFDMKMAEIIIEDTYGDAVSITQKKKTLLKFGQSEEVTTAERTIALLGAGESHEAYVSDNLITHFASEAADTTTAVVEGHTISGGVFTFVVQTITLAGTTKTALTTPLARISRVANTGATDWTGPIYFAEDVTFTSGIPQTESAIHLVVPGGVNQSLKAATTLSNVDYWIVNGMFASVNRKSAGDVDAYLQVRNVGGVFRPQALLSVSTEGSTGVYLPFSPPLIVTKNSDIRVTAQSLAGSGIAVSAWVNGYLATVV
jgi:hypothetical protein